MQGRTGTVAKTFDRICGLLTELGYLGADGTEVTPLGMNLRRLYTEKDLVAAECLRTGVWKALDAPSLAACVSALVHEPRSGEADPSPRMPTEEVGAAVGEMYRLWSVLEDRERDAALPLTNPPDGGMAWMVHRWASGQRLDQVLRGQDMAAGDFVRRCKQVVDLLGQITEAAHWAPSGDGRQAGPDREEPVRRTARRAVTLVLRGVVAADRLD